MKKILTLTILGIFSIILIGCSSNSNSPKSAANTNSAAAAKPVAQPSSAENKKANPEKMDDGKSDADKSNSNK